jgi:hypothetical protein
MKYRTKPFEIEAVRFTGDNVKEVSEFTGGAKKYFYLLQEHDHPESPNIVAEVYDEIHETWVGVRVGDYIIRGSKGEFYPCDPGVFAAKYEVAE